LLFCVKEKGLHRGTGKHACTDLKLRSCHGQNMYIYICIYTYICIYIPSYGCFTYTYMYTYDARLISYFHTWTRAYATHTNAHHECTHLVTISPDIHVTNPPNCRDALSAELL